MVQAIGTTLCLGTATVVVATGSYLLDVRDLPSFSHKMRLLMRPTALHKRLANDAETHDTEAGDAEWERLWQEGRQIDAERAELKRLKREKAKRPIES